MSDNARIMEVITMIDTIALSHVVPTPSDLTSKLEDWEAKYDSQGNIARWVFNIPDQARLTWSVGHEGLSYIRVEHSLPKLLRKNNVEMITALDVRKGLEYISEYTSNMTRHITHREFDANTARVVRVDYCFNFNVGEENIVPYISAVANRNVSRMDRELINDTSVYFKNKGKHKNREILLYGKLAELLACKKTGDELEAAKGMLRLESRFLRADSVNRLAKQMGFERPSSDLLLTQEIADAVLVKDLERLGLDKSTVPLDDRIATLLRAYPREGRGQRLAGFVALLDRYGEGFWKIPDTHTSKGSYYRDARSCKDVNVWRCALNTEALPPLRLNWDATT